MKKSFLISLFFFICIIQGGIKAGQPADRVVAFDLHGVVLHYNWKALPSCLWNFSNKWQLIKNLPYMPVLALIKTIWNKPSFEQILQLCGFHNPALKDLLVDLSVQQRLVTDVACIINKLAEQGIPIHVVSNIGSESFKRISNCYPETFQHFSVVVTSDMRDEDGALIKKPDPLFFNRYLQEQELEPGQVIFIDDRSKNIEVAGKLGMDAILFKNAEQLQNELKVRSLITD